MTQVHIYYEGDAALTIGLRTLLTKALPGRPLKELHWHSGGAKAIEKFLWSLRAAPGATNILLTDAEGPDDGGLWQRLIVRTEWKPTVPVEPDQAFFMVQMMEAWFLSDRAFLGTWYGQGFNPNALPANTQVEVLSKIDIIQGLKRATEKTQKGAYHKTRHAPMLLAGIDPVKLRRVSPHFDRLLVRIDALTA